MPVKTSRGIRGGAGAEADNVGAGSGPNREEMSSDDEDELGTSSSTKRREAIIDATKPLPPPPASLPPISPLLQTLVGLRCPSPLPTSLPPPPLPLFNENLNSSQTAALSRALASKDVHLIHGPPGTGKTTVLVELVLQLAVGRGERVLVAGSSNLAVDNLAARLIPFRKGREKDLKPIRVGREFHAASTRFPRPFLTNTLACMLPFLLQILHESFLCFKIIRWTTSQARPIPDSCSRTQKPNCKLPMPLSRPGHAPRKSLQREISRRHDGAPAPRRTRG